MYTFLLCIHLEMKLLGLSAQCGDLKKKFKWNRLRKLEMSLKNSGKRPKFYITIWELSLCNWQWNQKESKIVQSRTSCIKREPRTKPRGTLTFTWQTQKEKAMNKTEKGEARRLRRKLSPWKSVRHTGKCKQALLCNLLTRMYWAHPWRIGTLWINKQTQILQRWKRENLEM
jgi:hypothetical protein